jgi:hypothetical protein
MHLQLISITLLFEPYFKPYEYPNSEINAVKSMHANTYNINFKLIPSTYHFNLCTMISMFAHISQSNGLAHITNTFVYSMTISHTLNNDFLYMPNQLIYRVCKKQNATLTCINGISCIIHCPPPHTHIYENHINFLKFIFLKSLNLICFECHSTLIFNRHRIS